MRSSFISVIVEGYDAVLAKWVPAHTVDVPGVTGPLRIPAGLELQIGDVSFTIADPAKAREIATAIVEGLPATYWGTDPAGGDGR